jgi:hypothetical protein
MLRETSKIPLSIHIVLVLETMDVTTFHLSHVEEKREALPAYAYLQSNRRAYLENSFQIQYPRG